MKLRLTLAGLAAATLLLPAAHGQMSGTAHPETLDDQITTAPDPVTTPHYVKPSPDVPLTAAAPAAVSESSYVPSSDAPVSSPVAPDATVASTPAPTACVAPVAAINRRRPLDPDDMIVTSAPDVPGQVDEGSILRARLQNPLSTLHSHVGDTFLAELVEPITQHGQVLIPAGAQVRGRISEVHGGRRLTGRASIRLQPEEITFPDGTVHRLRAQLINLDNFADAHVNSEGTVIGTDHPKAILASLGLTTAGATVAGAIIGGGLGAGVGAAVGVGAGTIWFFKRDVQQELPVGTGLVFSLDEPFNAYAPAQTAQVGN